MQLMCYASCCIRSSVTWRYMILRPPLHCSQHWRATDRTALLCGFGWLTSLRQGMPLDVSPSVLRLSFRGWDVMSHVRYSLFAPVRLVK